MIWDRLLGHDSQVEMFRRAVGRGRLGHAYLFIGPRGIGKRFFARLLAQSLFCSRIPDEHLDACGECPSCVQMQAGTHPDLIEIRREEGKKFISIEQMAGDRENRGRVGLCHELAMAPMSAPRRIAVIDDADSMSPEATNSFLKTLEEPPAGAVLFLLTPDIEPILPTIRSRCQPVRFHPLSNDQLIRLLQEEKESGEVISPEIIDMAEGSLETARQLLDPGIHKLWQVVMRQLTGESLDAMKAVKGVGDALDDLGGDTAAQRLHMRWVVGFAVETLRRRLIAATTLDECDRLGLMLDRCFEAERHLQQTMPIPLCLEAMFTELGRRSRIASAGS